MPFALLEAGTCALIEAVAAAGIEVAFAVLCAVGVRPVAMVCRLVGDKLRVGLLFRDREAG